MRKCPRCGIMYAPTFVLQERCKSCQIEFDKPRTYSILHGGTVKPNTDNPFVNRAAQNRAGV